MAQNRTVKDGFKWIMAREALANFINRCFTKAGIVSGVVSTNITLAALTQYAIEGYMFSAPAVTSGRYVPQGAGYSTCASGQARLWAVCLDSLASLTLWAGSAVSAGQTTYLKDVPTSLCIVGLVKVSCASNFSFTVGTMAWGSASLVSCTVEYTDVSMIPQGVILSE
jgi:hypothetical protein